jgi:hypothetical protein
MRKVEEAVSNSCQEWHGVKHRVMDRCGYAAS